MKKEKGVGYCGLSCANCAKNDICDGCHQIKPEEKYWCENLRCCLEKGYNGCWECADFPCQGSMLDKLKIRAFATLIKEQGEQAFLNHLQRNEQNGVEYLKKGSNSGDYDAFESTEEILQFIKNN
ncbi:MAG: DUF3795 domain-containing protein [Erysipelotrichaceae bacterium]